MLLYMYNVYITLKISKNTINEKISATHYDTKKKKIYKIDERM